MMRVQAIVPIQFTVSLPLISCTVPAGATIVGVLVVLNDTGVREAPL